MNGLLIAAALSGALAVVAGAFGAHGASGHAAEWLLGLPRWLGAVTPIGGVLMIAGWLWLAWAAARG